MQPVVLLSGRLTRKRIDGVKREIAAYRKTHDSPIVLVIASDGGVVGATLEFIEWLENTQTRFTAKIYQAESAAALIAMAAEERQMVQKGILSVHLGSITVETSDVPDGRICGKVLADAKKLRARTFALMKKSGFPEQGKIIDKLLAQNRLTLSAEECQELGIVSEVV